MLFVIIVIGSTGFSPCTCSAEGTYYAPFDINSKNCIHIPEETETWFEELGDLLKASSILSAQGDHTHALECFDLLYELIDIMESGEEIVFADEYGSWMIPGNKKDFVAAYIQSLAATLGPEEFAERCVPLLERDRYQSFTLEAFKSAEKVATPEQRVFLKKAVLSRKIPTSLKPLL